MRDNRLPVTASTLSAPRAAATSYCDPGRHANVVTPLFAYPLSKRAQLWRFFGKLALVHKISSLEQCERFLQSLQPHKGLSGPLGQNLQKKSEESPTLSLYGDPDAAVRQSGLTSQCASGLRVRSVRRPPGANLLAVTCVGGGRGGPRDPKPEGGCTKHSSLVRPVAQPLTIAFGGSTC